MLCQCSCVVWACRAVGQGRGLLGLVGKLATGGGGLGKGDCRVSWQAAWLKGN